MHNNVQQLKTVEEEIEEGKEWSDILNFFTAIGMLPTILGAISFLLGIILVVVGYLVWQCLGRLSRLGHEIWCNLITIPAGIVQCLATGANVIYCMIGWNLIFFVLFPVLALNHLFSQFSNALRLGSLDLVSNVLLIISSIVQLYVGIYLSVVFTRIVLKYRRQNVR